VRDYERDGSAYFGPRCRCTSRNQKTHGAGVWECRVCGRWNHYRQTTEGYLPFTEDGAEGIDRFRKERVA
jgi:ribosomal protein L37AE/L43A